MMDTSRKRLDGKVALVTGGSRGIGNAAAVALAKAGALVAVNYKTHAAEAEAACREVESQGGRAIAVQADVSVADEVTRLVRHVVEALGPVAILVNNAGISRLQPFEQITERDWDEVLAVNLKSVFLVTQAVLPGMRAAKWGRIINLSSVAAQTGGVIGPHYAASKAGIHGLTHSYAALLAKEPAYGNLAELGLGVLSAFGINPIGEILLDEKLGLHLAFGRSDHFGGQVGPAQFSGPEAVIHIDRVYVPETQPDVKVRALDLKMADGEVRALIRNGTYAMAF